MSRACGVVSVALVLLLLALGACGKDDGCAPQDDKQACGWAVDRQVSCASGTTGIYGTASYSCAAHCPPDYGGCLDGTLTATNAARVTTPIAITNGFFASALAPGAYDLCHDDSGAVACAHVELAAGQRVRVGISIVASPGGRYQTINVYRLAGMACDPKMFDSCDVDLACNPGASPDQGTCGPPTAIPAGELCYPSPSSPRQCADGTTCTYSRHGASCTFDALSAAGGPCDSAHLCDPALAGPGTDYVGSEPLLHCDEPSKTCAVQGGEGAWCGAIADCNFEKGFNCLDANQHELPYDFSVAGSCVMRKPPGAACDQPYQCASGACARGQCS